MEKALGGAQEDLNSGSSLKRKDTDVIPHARMHIPHPPRELVKYATGKFMESSNSLVFCFSGDMRVKSLPMTEFVVRYSHLRPNRIGVVDDRLEWTNVAICLESIFQDVYCTLTVYTPETGRDFYPIPSHSRESTSREPNYCAVVTTEEMLMTKRVKERISWTRSESELAKQQRADSAIKIINCALQRYGVNLDDSHCTFGKNPISKEGALSWGNLKALELWSNSEDLATSNGVLYRKWKPSNRENECWQAIIPKEMRNENLY